VLPVRGGRSRRSSAPLRVGCHDRKGIERGSHFLLVRRVIGGIDILYAGAFIPRLVPT